MIASIGCLPQLRKADFGYKLDHFFSADNSDFKYYTDYKKQFGNENNFIMLSFEHEKTVYDSLFLNEIQLITDQLVALPELTRVLSPTHTDRKIQLPIIGIKSIPLLHLDDRIALQDDQKRIQENQSLYSNLFSTDGKSLLLYLIVSDTINKTDKTRLLTSIKAICESDKLTTIQHVYYAGQINTQGYYTQTLRRELVVFSGIALGLLILFLYLTYRRFKLVFFTVLTLIIAVIFSLTIIIVVLGELDFLMTLLPTILFVIGISVLIHLIEDYENHAEEIENGLTLFKKAQRLTFNTTFLSALTTAIGFFSLYFLPIQPVQNFGLYTGIGILITWLTSVLLFPSLMRIFPSKISSRKTGNWSKSLSTALGIIRAKKGVIGYTSLILFGLSLMGMTKLQVNSYFLDDLNPSSDLKKDLIHFENNYGGIRPFELGITANEGQLLDPNHILQLSEIQDYLDNTYHVSMSLSIITILKEMNATIHGGNSAYHVIPKDKAELAKLLTVAEQFKLVEKSGFLISSDLKDTRITGKIFDAGAIKIQRKNEDFKAFTEKFDSQLTFQVTGSAHLMDMANQNVTTHLLKGLIFSLLLVTVVIGIALRSARIAFLSILPNLFPLLVIAGLMGWLGIDLKIGTALIFTVLYGIAVDDTIHFLMRYKIEQKIDPIFALKNTYLHVGKKIVITSFIISAGFLSFTLSEFSSTFYAGLLITIGLVIALLTDLIQLPLLLQSINKNNQTK